MSKPITLSYVVPAFNEEGIIGETLQHFQRDFSDLSGVVGAYEIIVVDDGSSDGTAAVVEDWSRRSPEIRLIRHDKNRGAGEAILTGLRASRMEWFGTNFADRPFRVSDISKVAAFFEDHDVIVACRNRRTYNWYRKLLSAGNYALIRLLFGSGIRDFQFVQFYRRAALERMRLISKSTLVAPEMILRSIRQGGRVREIFLDCHERNGGKPKYGHPKYILKTVRDMVKLRIDLWNRRTMP